MLHGVDSALQPFVFLFGLALQRARGNRRSDAVAFGLSAAIAGTLATLCAWSPGAWDLTAERRYTLTPGTRTFLTELQDDVVVTCYLTGSFPAEWKRLEQSIRTQLERFADVSGGRVRYQFIDIYASEDPKTKNGCTNKGCGSPASLMTKLVRKHFGRFGLRRSCRTAAARCRCNFFEANRRRLRMP